MNFADAETALRAAGLALGQLSRTESPEVRGTVLAQSPDAGALVPRGSAVNLEVASGANALPQVGGMNAATAVAALQSAGFTVAPSQSILPGTTQVQRTDPAEGTVLRLGVTVTLVLDDTGTTPTSIPPGTPTSLASP